MTLLGWVVAAIVVPPVGLWILLGLLPAILSPFDKLIRMIKGD